MDIHKPKPWHGGREFVKEIGTIVIGVLIALGAEQAVEWLHWRIEAAEAREALKEEVRIDATNSAASVVESRCMGERLQDLVALARGGAHADMGEALLTSPNSTAWDVAKAGQALSHMPLKERLAFGHFYASVANQQVVIQSVRTAGATQLLRYTQKTELTPDEARHMLEDVAVARTLYFVRGRNDAALVKAAKALGVDPAPPSAETQVRLANLCRPGAVQAK
jgi:hypothetical protein